jgi:hypothetical protein
MYFVREGLGTVRYLAALAVALAAAGEPAALHGVRVRLLAAGGAQARHRLRVRLTG